MTFTTNLITSSPVTSNPRSELCPLPSLGTRRTATHTHSHIYTHSHTHTHLHAHSHTLTFTRTLTHIYIHTHSHLHAHTHIYTQSHIFTHTHSYRHSHTHTQVFACTVTIGLHVFLTHTQLSPSGNAVSDFSIHAQQPPDRPLPPTPRSHEPAEWAKGGPRGTEGARTHCPPHHSPLSLHSVCGAGRGAWSFHDGRGGRAPPEAPTAPGRCG